VGKPTRHQQIWETKEDTNELKIPKTISSDVGFQLMFGEAENNELETRKQTENEKNYTTKIYTEEEIKIWLK